MVPSGHEPIGITISYVHVDVDIPPPLCLLPQSSAINMASNDNNPRRPEDNPFIAFRRFADSQASSLFNTVFSLPAHIAGFKNVQQARKQCLFGKADERQCDKLYEIESEIAARRRIARQLFRVGDHQGMSKNGDELVNLHKQADELRRDILGLAPVSDAEKELMQRVGNEKGQEWGWSHSWGWPAPFDEKIDSSRGNMNNDEAQPITEKDLLLHLQSEFKDMMGADGETMAAFLKFFLDETSHNDPKARERRMPIEEKQGECQRPRTWAWSRSWQWPPPADSMRHDDASYSPRALDNDPELNKVGVQWRQAYDELVRTEQKEEADSQKYSNWKRGCGRHRHWGRPAEQDMAKQTPQQQLEAVDEPSYEYSHDHEDQHDEPPSPKVSQGKSVQVFQAPKEENQVARQDQEFQQSLERQRQAKQQFWELFNHEDTQERKQAWEQAQEQGNTPPSTELDAYEQLLDSKEQQTPQLPLTTTQPDNNNNSSSGTKPSILSTMTTTERTIAPDGSVTTKVMLKKRFTDGREESSETVHTARGHEDSPRYQDPWKAIREAETAEIKKEIIMNKKSADKTKKSGWFWSS